MKRINRILLTLGCVVLLLSAWLAVATAKSDSQRQEELLEQANIYLEDELYVRAEPLLEEAAGYEDRYTLEAEEGLKKVYLHLIDQGGYARKYTQLLEKQMAREGAGEEIFREAAEYYFALSKEEEALSILRTGIEKTGSPELTELYEANRYAYKLGRSTYEEATGLYNGAIQVRRDDLWGLANASGDLVIPCEYDKISTYSDGQAVAQKDGVTCAVNSDNNRVALYHGSAQDITNFSGNRLGLKLSDGWRVADGNFYTAEIVLEELGMYTEGCAAAKQNGRWGVLSDDGATWIVPPEYDGVILDELGRCCSQNAVFLRRGEEVVLFVDGEPTGYTCEDAWPFGDGWAAVKKDGKWGFIDTSGAVQIGYQFEEARSFGQHLAAVRQGDYWGYLSLRGEVVIEPIFLSAGQFSQGCAPVETEDGWRFLSLLEY